MGSILAFVSEEWKTALEIAVIAFVIYRLLIFTRGTVAFQVLRGLSLLIIVFYIAQALGLWILAWILTHLFAFSLLAFLILFQPELRALLARVGGIHLLGARGQQEKTLREVLEAVETLSRRRIGALIAIEREAGLRGFAESGVLLDAQCTSELLCTIFTPNAPLHDGGVIVLKGRIEAAGCLFPLTQNPKVTRGLGTRHRAAIGLTEETDAMVIVVSEETGAVSVATQGRLTHDLDAGSLEKILSAFFRPHTVHKVEE